MLVKVSMLMLVIWVLDTVHVDVSDLGIRYGGGFGSAWVKVSNGEVMGI